MTTLDSETPRTPGDPDDDLICSPSFVVTLQSASQHTDSAGK